MLEVRADGNPRQWSKATHREKEVEMECNFRKYTLTYEVLTVIFISKDLIVW